LSAAPYLPQYDGMQADVRRLANLRRGISVRLSSLLSQSSSLSQSRQPSDDDVLSSARSQLQEYAAALRQLVDELPSLERRGDDVDDGGGRRRPTTAVLELRWRTTTTTRTRTRRKRRWDDGGTAARRQQQQQQQQQQQDDVDDDEEDSIVVATSLLEEHRNAVWDIAALYASEVRRSVAAYDYDDDDDDSNDDSNDNAKAAQLAWKKAMTTLPLAACAVQYLRETTAAAAATNSKRPTSSSSSSSFLLSSRYLLRLERALVGDSQMAAYRCFASMPGRPKHNVLAKLAAATRELYSECSDDDDDGPDGDNNGDNVYFHDTDDTDDTDDDDDDRDLVVSTRACAMYWSSVAEYHQAMHCSSRREHHREATARLDASLSYATLCQKYCGGGGAGGGDDDANNNNSDWTTQLRRKLDKLLQDIQTAFNTVVPNSDVDGANSDDPHLELTEIPSQKMAKLNKSDLNTKVLPPLSRPLEVLTATVVTAAAASSNSSTSSTTTTTPGAGFGGGPQSRGGGSSSSNSASFSTGTPPVRPRRPGSLTPPRTSSPAAATTTTTTVDPLVRRYAEQFLADMERRLEETTALASDKTESARRALSAVQLPHSLTAYQEQQRQQQMDLLQNGTAAATAAAAAAVSSSSSLGGRTDKSARISDDLWDRVRAVQADHTPSRVQQELWGLRDLADEARRTYDGIQSSLKEDMDVDELFRRQHPEFSGHDVAHVQRSFREALQKYDRLMTDASESDAVLIEKSQSIERDPKFKLIHLRRSQLDALLSQEAASIGRAGAAGSGLGAHVPEIDVSALSNYLVELSSLFDERATALSRLKLRIQSYDMEQELSRIDPASAAGTSNLDRAYRDAVERAKRSLDPAFRPIQDSIDRQREVLGHILRENEAFMRARESHSANDGYATKIEAALQETEQFAKHLVEGRAFYDVILPKLEKLREQIGDVSARLTNERCEHEDRARRSRQEAEDARMAATLAHEDGRRPDESTGGQANDDSYSDSYTGDYNGSSPNPALDNSGTFQHPHPHQQRHGGGGSSSHPDGGTVASSSSAAATAAASGQRVPANPGVEQVSHDEPAVRVDDQKVATLVAMEFDADSVVAALRRHDNDFDRALNDLLEGQG